MKNDPKQDQKPNSELEELEDIEDVEDTNSVTDAEMTENTGKEASAHDIENDDTDTVAEPETEDESSSSDENEPTEDMNDSEDADEDNADEKSDKTEENTDDVEVPATVDKSTETENTTDTATTDKTSTSTEPDSADTEAENEESQKTQDELEALESSEDPSVFKDKESADINTADTPTTPTLPTQNFALPIAPIERKWYHNRSLVIALVAVVIIALASAAYAFYLVNTQPRVKPATKTIVEKTETPKPLAPFAVAYSIQKDQDAGQAADDCLASTTTIYQQALSGGAPVTATALSDNQSVVQQDVHQKTVLVATGTGCSSKEGVGLWISKDSGKTYEKLFTGTKPTDTTLMGEQITSAIISNDGKSVVFGLLPEAGSKNTVRVVDIETKEVKNLFTADQAGVFLSAYDASTQKLYYSNGCYNCDASPYGKMLVRDLANNTDSVLFNDQGYVGQMNVVKSDLSKVLRVKTSQQDILSDITYVVEEFDIASKKGKVLTTFTAAGGLMPVVGYTDSDNTAYYTNDKQLHVVGSDSKARVLLQADKTITAVHYLGKDKVVYSTGGAGNYSLVSYSVESKESSALLDYDHMARIFGVTWN